MVSTRYLIYLGQRFESPCDYMEPVTKLSLDVCWLWGLDSVTI